MNDYTDEQVAIMNAVRDAHLAFTEDLRALRQHPDITADAAQYIDFLIDKYED